MTRLLQFSERVRVTEERQGWFTSEQGSITEPLMGGDSRGSPAKEKSRENRKKPLAEIV